mgnify:CR=1 FL=1
MTGSRMIRLVGPAIALLVALTACSGSDGANDEQNGSATSVVPTTATAAPTTTAEPAASGEPATTATDDDPTATPNLVELRSDLGVDVLVLDPATESGSHPMLSWQPTDGAASYWLTIRDADARPYWAWTGTETNVRIGGGDSPDTNQTAVLHETMTWRVAAFDSSGGLVAISDTATVSP